VQALRSARFGSVPPTVHVAVPLLVPVPLLVELPLLLPVAVMHTPFVVSHLALAKPVQSESAWHCCDRVSTMSEQE
jgi:hypothetical protein